MLEKAPVSIHSSAHAEEGEADEQELSAMQIIENLGGALYALRQEALNWRAQTGIEDDWNEDEEFYDARDNANPEGETNVGKPLSPNGGAENRAVPMSTPRRLAWPTCCCPTTTRRGSCSPRRAPTWPPSPVAA
jgi:hypothetical protein